jgi:DNA-binding CsgD family transcriptional regulator
MSDRISRLTPRQREALRLVHARYVTKEIADELGISVDRVNKIVREAMLHLDVSRREIAARLLAEHEAREIPTHSVGAQTMGVVKPEKSLSDQPAETFGDGERDEEEADFEAGRTTADSASEPPSHIPFPFPTSGRPRNELKRSSILIAIATIAVLGAGIAGAAISLLFDINRLVTGT